ncbi:efflux RND transporter periplasmic adaptor subunit [Legionella hackeliae]|uniref:RND efflux membrane fusion protein, acriflavin resistance protein E n=1 Tax=Legionella hackeliae TaxID=449 RepID=A0A0A8URH5_LEGHA|nr:efflux RND transporter periplasmic adaptor subunit [Legionella hackeliae]KTD15284.1 RND efflux membrane fusion protein, acriflavin resistance protein E [Legionella hackeliae]CEK11348.1 RND efflux membrane fusion protein, acriflavin resistance protein E [Legionella hackeliae]STX48120.1 RND efflux membrane fusion protein, acriflavin resistance protein E [Legionella hackeliae]
MKKRMTIMLIALGVVFGGIVAFNLFKSFMIKRFFASYEPPAVSVSSVTAIKKNWEPRIAAVGNFVAINGVDVNAQIAGNIVKIHFESGQYLEKDQPLVDIDDSVDQATLKFNKADLALKELNYKRQADLFKRGATPSSNVDEALANLQQAQANVERTEAEIKQKHITAPFSGQLGIRQVNLGQYITPGQTSVVTLQSMDPLFLEFYLPEQMLKRLHINQQIQFNVEGAPDKVFTGKITAINAKVDTNTHNVLVQATVPNCSASELSKNNTKKSKDNQPILIKCDSNLNAKNHVTKFTFIPGMFASISVEQPPIPDTVVLPSTAISYSLYGNSVFVIEKDEHGKKDSQGQEILRVRRVFVSTGEQDGNYTVIKKGIKPGQQVVSSGELKLQNGTRVVINNSVKLQDVANPDQLGQ